MNRSITRFIVAAALAVTVLVAAAFGDPSSASLKRPSKGAIVALGKTALGNVLIDARGRTLYRFEADKRGNSTCYVGCATYWLPLTSSAKPRAARGVHASLLGLRKRTDGKRQVTYAGHPLYTFIGDTRAGQTTREGLPDFGAAWYVVAASGRAIERTAFDAGGPDGGYGGYGSGR
jgi:predicted lipoprotein with Yx(FWY)xxD motif